MPQVSKKELDKNLSKKIYELLTVAIVNDYVSKKRKGDAFGELLTDTEKIMLCKRLAAVSLLSQGVSTYRTGKVLQLSITTTLKLRLRLDSGRLSNTEKLCKALMKTPLQRYLENLLKPLPSYGTSPSSLFKDN